ncbi:HEAT repeat domain-containing protein [Breznakiellaceae bacterium SP9]
MKKIFLFTLCSLFTAALFAQSNQVAYYMQQYDTATSISNQLTVLRTAQKEGFDGLSVFYTNVLEKIINNFPNIKTPKDRRDTEDSVNLITTVLSENVYKEAALTLWQAVNTFPTGLVRSNALIALGKTGDLEFVEPVAKLLDSINTVIPSDKSTQVSQGQVAFGAVSALESFKDARGYLPVFFVATGWYEPRIKRAATNALPAILEDPTTVLLAIIENPGYDYAIKLQAINVIDSSKVDNAQKSRAAASALNQGWLYTTNDPKERLDLAGVRKKALLMLKAYGSDDASVYANINKSYIRPLADTDEKIRAITTLGALAADDAVKLLSDYLLALHNKKLDGDWGNVDDQLIREIIAAIKQSKNWTAWSALNAVIYSPEHTPRVKALAKKAQDALVRK